MGEFGESTDKENARLYMRGVNEARRGESLDATALIEILDVFGENGARSYLVGYAEGEDDPEDDEM